MTFTKLEARCPYCGAVIMFASGIPNGGSDEIDSAHADLLLDCDGQRTACGNCGKGLEVQAFMAARVVIWRD